MTVFTHTLGGQGDASLPAGLIMDYAGSSAPAGWLLCNGAAVSRATYPDLFDAIGTIWGAGNGTTTFNVPNLPDFTRGSNGGSVGATGGAASVTLTTGQIPQMTLALTDPGHAHAVSDSGHTHTITDPGHAHPNGAVGPVATLGAAAGGLAASNSGSAVTGITVDSATTGVTVNSASTGITGTVGATSPTSVAIIPSFAVVLRVIKT